MYTKFCDEIKNHIETINSGETIKYKKDFMKIRFESDDNLPLGNILSIPIMMTVVRCVFQKDNECYPEIYLHDCVYV